MPEHNVSKTFLDIIGLVCKHGENPVKLIGGFRGTVQSIPVPLNADAVLVLRRQVGKNCTRVFTYKGRPVTRANNHAWRKALVRAGIKNFRWHDLRHTWASWHVQQGTPLHVLQELGGWSDCEMVRRYAHLSVEHLAEYADNLSRAKLVGTNLAQSDNGEEKKRKV